jgi:two-component system chemotaxis response regulator CheY
MELVMNQDKKRLGNFGILVVDADGGYRRLVITELRNLGARNVHGAAKAEQALEILNVETIDVIITEYYLPFVQSVRTHTKPSLRRLPIILVTNNTTKDDVLAARDAGINTFVAKPVSAAALCDQILRAMSDRRPIVEAENFSGPDRRRPRGAAAYPGPDRRRNRVSALQ